MMIYLIDYFFTAIHLVLVVFILSGWISPKTRKLHVTAMLLMVMSWMLLGLYQGSIGYCPLTEWHWDVKNALGETQMPDSFIEYVIEGIVGINFSQEVITAITGLGLVFGVVMSAFSHRKEQVKAKEKKHHLA